MDDPDKEPKDYTSAEAGAKEEKPESPAGNSVLSVGLNRLRHAWSWYLARKKWTISLSVLIVLIVLAAVPWTRYNLAGLIIKRNLQVKVIDSVTNTPVSGAMVSIGSINAETNGTGEATLHDVKAGRHLVTFSKKYYKNKSTTILAPIFKQKDIPSVSLDATGRQVKVTVTNLINKTLLSNVSISVAGISAKTDKTGSAIIVLPVGKTEEKATLSLKGYNPANVTIRVSNTTIQDNPFTLTPAGKVYFLSNLSGKIDVVKTNLDGTDRQTILAGTGNEDPNNTVLLASRDWKYLALLSRRAGNFATLYLIDTSNDSVSTIDEGNASFELIGWSGHYFIYVVDRPNVQPWQPKAQTIKSFNAQTKQLASLDSTNATGSSNADANYETYILKPILLDNLIVYVKTWYAYPGYLNVSGQSNTLNIIHPDGTGKKTVKSLDSGKSYFGNMVFHTPSSIYVQVSNLDSSPSTFYEINGSGVLAQKNNLSTADMFKSYPTYLASPDGKHTFWTEPRDGKNTLFVGDSNGANGKQIATLSDYTPYGWYSSDYLLVSKDSSELYIMPKDGTGNTVKVSDYYKPAQTFPGYGGGYGGL